MVTDEITKAGLPLDIKAVVPKSSTDIINFKLAQGTTADVEAIEYDPNRTARIARVKKSEGLYHYILAAKEMKVGQTIPQQPMHQLKPAIACHLRTFRLEVQSTRLSYKSGGGAQLARSAGNSAQLMGIENGYAQVRLPSGEVRLINVKLHALVVGVIGNEQHQNIKIGKAGRNRHKGIRPSVRGVVMNAVDHPHGGGDGGRHGIGGGKNHGSAPKTPWGQKTFGYKTSRRKSTSQFIVRSRHEAKRR